ncbi:unnamed protein product [Phytomonas sp. EM1]|nr:unnamed protein product [Phytomonas sp. EM1]|eukprot:CCW60158.1 unnamed protein product [Phytomonas sp. isolate EM1]
MIVALMFLNLRGDLISSHLFRTDYSVRYLADTFRRSLVCTKKSDRCPVNIIDNLCYIHLTLSEIFIVMVANGNDDCFLCMQYMIRLLQTIQAYYESINESVIKENFAVIQEIINESLDFGYPFLTEKACLIQVISESGIKEDILKNQGESERITSKITGAVPWREEGLIFQNNEVFLNVFEEINLLLSPTGDVLQSDVMGKVVMNSFLSGMPNCELTLNARIDSDSLERKSEENQVTLSDVSFHTCVRFDMFSAKQCLRFVPPDGKFTLIQYRSSEDFSPPLRIVSARMEEVSKTRIEVQFCLKSDSYHNLKVSNVEVIVPCPEDTVTVSMQVPKGRVKFQVTDRAIVWRLPSLGSGEEIPFHGEMKRLASTVENTQALLSKPPINISFECASRSISGLKVIGLKVEEPMLMYGSNKWVRYTSKAGKYQCYI